jgi:hypothetical protein
MRHLKTLLAPTSLMLTIFWATLFSIAPVMNVASGLSHSDVGTAPL